MKIIVFLRIVFLCLKIRVTIALKTFIKSIEVIILDQLLLSVANATQIETIEVSIDESNEFDDDSTTEMSTTVVIPSNSTSDESPAEQVYWKIISITFIVTTTFLIIISVCLWRSLPSSLNPVRPEPKSY